MEVYNASDTMKEGITEMSESLRTVLNTTGLREQVLQRILRIAQEELTPLEWDTVRLIILEGKSQREVAAAKGVNPSTVSRNLNRAVTKLQRFAKYL